jgi:hypothetical protein
VETRQILHRLAEASPELPEPQLVQFGSGELPYLTERDRLAPDLSEALNRDTPRDPRTWPVTEPLSVPTPAAGMGSAPPELAKLALNNLGRHIAGLAMAVFNKAEPAPADIPANAGDAHSLISRLAKDAFGR